jgi:hypothetical protein
MTTHVAEATLGRSSISRYGESVIEIRGSSEDGDSNSDPLPVVDHSTTTVNDRTKPRSSIQETKKVPATKHSSMRERPISSNGVWKPEPDEEEEVEEEWEKGNPPRKRPRR